MNVKWKKVIIGVSILLFTNTGLDTKDITDTGSNLISLNSPFHEYWFRCNKFNPTIKGWIVSILLFTNTGLDMRTASSARFITTVSILLFTNTGLDNLCSDDLPSPRMVSILLFTNTGLDNNIPLPQPALNIVSILLFTNTGLDNTVNTAVSRLIKKSQFSFSRILV